MPKARHLAARRHVTEPAQIGYVGPMAHDFRAVFGLGDNDRVLSHVVYQDLFLVFHR